MFGIYSKLVAAIAQGRLRQPPQAMTIPMSEPPPLPQPPYWSNAVITHAMADSRRADWERVLARYRGELKSVLEIGSYEGQSALFWSNFLGAHVTCIDTWTKVWHGANEPREVERHFDANLGRRARKIKSESTPALHRLARDGAMFDLVYVDGDHSRDQVMVDSILAWRCLRVGGVMIWDDYESFRPEADDRARPVSAVNYFVAMQGKAVSVIENTGQQLFARKME